MPIVFRFVDAVLTIPKGTLFPMCGMNLAFNRELIGPAMYFGLMGDGQPIGRYDDMWAGWCMKVSISHRSVLPVIFVFLCHYISLNLQSKHPVFCFQISAADISCIVGFVGHL